MSKRTYAVACCGLMTLLHAGHAAAIHVQRWATIEGGYVWSSQPDNTITQQMSGVNLPDNYVANALQNRGIMGVGAGVQFLLPENLIMANNTRHWFPSNRIGLFYDYYTKAQVSGQIDKWQTTPTYSYTYNVNSSNTLWLDNQLDLVQIGRLLPFFDVAIGAAWNKTSSYQESPLPFVPSSSVRLNGAAFASNTTTDFAWRVGMGGNLKLTDKLNLGIVYHYASLGNASTGNSANYASMTSINNALRGNELVFSLRYDFDTIGETK